MKRNLSLSLFLVLGAAAAGCAADAPTVGGGDDSPTDPNNPPDDNQPVPLTAEGKFAVQSQFDLAANMPGTAGTVINTFISATDDPDDPTKFIVDKLIAALPDGSVKNFAQSSAPFVTGYLNDRLLQVAPDLLGKIVDTGNKFGQVAHNFGTLETLEIDAAGHATKVVTGVHFSVDNIDLDYVFHDYGMADIVVDNVNVTLEPTGKLSIGEHTVALSYGAVLKVALDQAIIPLIDPSASNLSDLLHNSVDCQKVGQYVYEALDFGSPSTYQTACTAGLTAGANAVYTQISHIDSAALKFSLAGTAKGVDKNHDGKMDEILTGTWAGTTSYAGSPAPLATAKFHGAKM